MSNILNQNLKELRKLVGYNLTVVEYYDYDSEYNETNRNYKVCYSFDDLKFFIESFREDSLIGGQRSVISIKVLKDANDIEGAVEEYYQEFNKIREERYRKEKLDSAIRDKEKRRQQYLKLKEEFDNEDKK